MRNSAEDDDGKCKGYYYCNLSRMQTPAWDLLRSDMLLLRSALRGGTLQESRRMWWWGGGDRRRAAAYRQFHQILHSGVLEWHYLWFSGKSQIFPGDPAALLLSTMSCGQAGWTGERKKRDADEDEDGMGWDEEGDSTDAVEISNLNAHDAAAGCPGCPAVCQSGAALYTLDGPSSVKCCLIACRYLTTWPEKGETGGKTWGVGERSGSIRELFRHSCFLLGNVRYPWASYRGADLNGLPTSGCLRGRRSPFPRARR